MFNNVKKFFSASSDGMRKAEGMDRSHDIRVATCALFLEMARIDGKFSDSEKDYIINTLKEDYQLPGETVDELLEASERQLEGSIDLWQFTNLINQNYSLEEKMRVLELFWKLAYADGKLESHEDYLVHKLANLLRLTHKQLIEAKMKVRNSL